MDSENETPAKESTEKVQLRRVRSGSASRSDVRIGYIRFACPNCKAVNTLESELGGKPTRCGECQEFFIAPKDAFSEGVVIGDYTLGKRIGEGAMGTVYSAHQRSLDRACALKILHEKYQEDKELAAALIREAQTAAKLVHPNIVQCYAVGREDRMVFYAMEHVEGETLSAYFLRQPRLSISTASEILIQLASALEYAWNKFQIVHRDIKPDNIMISPNLEVKLADLGLARPKRLKNKYVDIITPAQELPIKSASVLSSQMFISPELARGEEVDHRSDIFSLGSVFYRSITGRHPFEAASPEDSIQRVLNEAIVNPQQIVSDLPEEVTTVLNRMLAKKPEERYQDYQSLLADLKMLSELEVSSSNFNLRNRLSDSAIRRAAVEVSPRQTQNSSTTQAPQAPAKSGGSGMLIAGLVVVILVLGGGYFAYTTLNAKPANPSKSGTANKVQPTATPKSVSTPPPVLEVAAVVDPAKLRREAEAAKSIAQRAREAAVELNVNQTQPAVLAEGDALLLSAERFYEQQKDELALGAFNQAGRRFADASFAASSAFIAQQLGEISETDWLAYAPQGWEKHLALSTKIAELEKADDPTEALKTHSALRENVESLRGEAVQGLLSLSQAQMTPEGFALAEVYLTRALQINPDELIAKQLLQQGRSTLKYKLGSTYKNSIGMNFIYVAPGEFTMGSPESESGREQDEIQRTVKISKGYFLGETEVTWGQWRAVMGDVKPSSLESSTVAEDDNQPVSTVTWEDAVRFCEALQKMENGPTYRLPTEAEWEYACRAATTETYAFGSTTLTISDAAIYDPIKILEGPAAVASIGKPNAWGFKDMHGNVWEWCADWYAPYVAEESVDPTGPTERPGSIDASPKIARGGSWFDDAVMARSANRTSFMPVIGTDFIGFRVLLEPANLSN